MHHSIQTYFRSRTCRDDQRVHDAELPKRCMSTGLMNMQYAIEDGKVYVLGGKSASFPYGSIGIESMCNLQMVKLATQIMTRELTGKSFSDRES